MNVNKKRGTLLLENIVFIILNLLFISILILFISLKSENAAVLEEIYAKQIALIIDSSKPGMIINLNMENAIEKAEKELGEDKIKDIVSIDNDNNIVTVKLREQGGYEYSFFNDIDVTAYPDTNRKEYVIVVNKAKEDFDAEE